MTCRLGKKLPATIYLRESSDKGNVETENLAFNNKYKIDTDDPHYMFYVLTPHFMEYILSADESVNGRTYFYFAGDIVHIGMDTRRDPFEIPSSTAAKSDPSIARELVKSEMKYFTDILDQLFLNKYLFETEE